jgi:glutathione S-transferase
MLCLLAPPLAAVSRCLWGWWFLRPALLFGSFAPAMRPDLSLPPKPIPAATLATIVSWLGASGGWLCGAVPTLADISCFCEVGQCQAHFCDMVRRRL